MDRSLLCTTSSSQLCPKNPLLFRLPLKTHRVRYRVSPIRSSAAKETSSDSNIFGGKRELSGIQVVADGLTPPVRLACSAVIVAGAIAAGYGLGFRFGGSRNVGLGAAAVVGAAGGAAAYALNSCVPEVAAVNLHNLVAGHDDPTTLRKEDIEEVAKRCDFCVFFIRCPLIYMNIELLNSTFYID